MPWPQPQQRWKRGTELPSPYTPRSAQFTTGKNQTPCRFSQPPTSSRARATYCSAQRRGHTSSSSKPASVCQSCQASSNESLIPERRCSAVSTMNVPPNASRASPPSSCGSQRSSSRTSRPNSSSSREATRPAMPAPMTTTSLRAMTRKVYRNQQLVDQLHRLNPSSVENGFDGPAMTLPFESTRFIFSPDVRFAFWPFVFAALNELVDRF